MLYSMTGYGRAEMAFNDKTLLVEVKSLNGKQFDVRLNIPSIYHNCRLYFSFLLDFYKG